MERSNRARQEREIDLLDLALTLLSQWYIIVAVTVVVGIGAAGFFFLKTFSPDEYSASTTLYVRNQLSGENTISTSDAGPAEPERV